jgi:hypothetical protein
MLLSKVWRAIDPESNTPNDCFCRPGGERTFRHNGTAILAMEEMVDRWMGQNQLVLDNAAKRADEGDW